MEFHGVAPIEKRETLEPFKTVQETLHEDHVPYLILPVVTPVKEEVTSPGLL